MSCHLSFNQYLICSQKFYVQTLKVCVTVEWLSNCAFFSWKTLNLTVCLFPLSPSCSLPLDLLPFSTLSSCPFSLFFCSLCSFPLSLSPYLLLSPSLPFSLSPSLPLSFSPSLPLLPSFRGDSTPSEGHCRRLLCPSLLRTVCPLLAAWCPGVCMCVVMEILPYLNHWGLDLALPRPQTVKGIIWS